MTTQPWVQKNVFSTEDALKIRESEFFGFFESKKLKLGIAVTSGVVGTISNYHAVRHQISESRFDMIGSSYADIYAIGLTAFLDMMIIVFYLMRDRKLINISSFSTITISVYSNLMLSLHAAGGSNFKTLLLSFLDPGLFFKLFVSLTMATLPIIVLKHCMELLVKQLENEKTNA